MGGDVVGDAVLLTVDVGIGLFVGGHDGLVSLAGALVSDFAGSFAGALASTDSFTGALVLPLSLDSTFAGSLEGALASALVSTSASFAGALAFSLDSVLDSLSGALSLVSALTVVGLDYPDSSAPAGIAPSRNRSATIIAATPLLTISLFSPKR